MKKFVGDLSRQDAEIIERYASHATSVLEFGVGGSTQIIAQAIPADSKFLSLDTNQEWIETTRTNLRRLDVEGRVRIGRYENWRSRKNRYDLIFNDGSKRLRREFALRSFPLLVQGGVMLFHDTRRADDVKNVTALVENFFEEIESVNLNERVEGKASNITVVKKKVKEPYSNWNKVEGKPRWAMGLAQAPESFWSK